MNKTATFRPIIPLIFWCFVQSLIKRGLFLSIPMLILIGWLLVVLTGCQTLPKQPHLTASPLVKKEQNLANSPTKLPFNSQSLVKKLAIPIRIIHNFRAIIRLLPVVMRWHLAVCSQVTLSIALIFNIIFGIMMK